VKDASRAVGIAQALISKDQADGFIAKTRTEYAEIRQRHQDRGAAKRLVSLDTARTQRFDGNWSDYALPAPRKPGLTVFDDYPLAELVQYIDWSPFFNTWELSGRFPAILEDATVGAQARELYRDARTMLAKIVAEKWLTARAAIGLWPAVSVGDDVEIGRDWGLGIGDSEKATAHLNPPTRLHFLRQQADKPAERPDFCLADFIAPAAQTPSPLPLSREGRGEKSSPSRGELGGDGVKRGRSFTPNASQPTPLFPVPNPESRIPASDWIGAFALTTGIGIEAHLARFDRDHDDYSAILLKALADRLAEAFAERMHARVRREFWGYASDEALDNDALIAENYRGIRPAPGYPACPDHTEKATLFALLDATRHTGIELTEGFAMYPAASVAGLYFAHPRSQYFVLGRISKEQVEDYARRKGWTLAEAERWLAQNLDYDPE
jgi:5-methyltetrahydrofolate--homocysteine methyltransferase